MTDTQPSELIWFQHFHKAGGSSLVEAARAAGRQFFPQNANGNPRDEHGKDLPLWAWGTDELCAWLTEVMSMGVNFVACEWGYSKKVLEKPVDNLRTVTILRNPVNRLISNFYYDVLNGYARQRDIRQYVNTKAQYTKPDYYTRMITGSTGADATRESFASLKKFDHIAFLEFPESFADLRDLIPDVTKFHSNKTNRNQAELQDLKKNVTENISYLEERSIYEMALYDALRKNLAEVSLP